MFPSPDLAGMKGSDTPAESADPVIPTRRQSSSIVECIGQLGPGGTLLQGEDEPGLCPVVSTDDLLSVTAVPLTAVRDPVIAQLPVEELVWDCDDVGERHYCACRGYYGGNGCLAEEK